MAEITVESSIVIAAPRGEVFRYVAEWQNAPRYVPNITSLRQVGAIGYGLGTRLRGSVQLPGLPLRGVPMASLSEVVQFVAPERIVTHSVEGVESTNTWLFHVDRGGTRLTAILTCRLPGHLLGRLVARLLSRALAESVAASLDNLKRLLERQGVAGKDGPTL